jgi:hypothetical protein
MKAISVAIVIVFALSVAAQTTKQNDLKTLNEFFNDPYKQKLSGCDLSTWESMHRAIEAGLTSSPLNSDSQTDFETARQISQCEDIVSQKHDEAFLDLHKAIRKTPDEINSGDIFRYSKDPTLAAKLSMGILGDEDGNLTLLSEYNDLGIMYALTLNAKASYINHAQELKYRALVERYNALANSLANVRLAQGSSFPIQPHALHCESKTDFLGVTRMDCN